ncbi:MAG: translation initiation factor IF-3 [Bacteroidales bacterium]|nr:translation initiation factor IF-3 [Bacteroidales bacterium]MBQ2097130.1 translation initiation factor IF-3 [Bacteroidales bacterium]MBQ5513100.1 translation initiation factor IF-3 [Bacteroidales bacterium]MBQ5550867.1 translation initiation factor IF-3 [Bacteroidales bacterium]MBQ5576173.1 translation initiation factor IF-3 [Bacteroidales bacterium]
MAKQNEQPKHFINESIKAREVRLVGENIEDNNKVVSTREALRLAEEQGLDLVMITADANPPVCKIVDYSKFLYQLKKKLKEQKANTKKTEVKEIRFGPQTDDHDFEFKLNHAKRFLADGDMVRAYVFFKGRSIVYKEQGEILLLKFATQLEGIGKVDRMPSLEGKKMIMLISPVKKKA